MIFQPLCDLKPPGGRASAPLRNQELVSRRTHPTVDGPPTIGCRDPPAVHQILPLVVRTEPGETVGLPAAPYARGCPRAAPCPCTDTAWGFPSAFGPLGRKYSRTERIPRRRQSWPGRPALAPPIRGGCCIGIWLTASGLGRSRLCESRPSKLAAMPR